LILIAAGVAAVASAAARTGWTIIGAAIDRQTAIARKPHNFFMLSPCFPY
jgi:hypothetical protein